MQPLDRILLSRVPGKAARQAELVGCALLSEDASDNKACNSSAAVGRILGSVFRQLYRRLASACEHSSGTLDIQLLRLSSTDATHAQVHDV